MVKNSKALEETATWRVHIHSLKYIARLPALSKSKRYIPLRTGYFLCLTDKLKCTSDLFTPLGLTNYMKTFKLKNEFMYTISANRKVILFEISQSDSDIFLKDFKAKMWLTKTIWLGREADIYSLWKQNSKRLVFQLLGSLKHGGSWKKKLACIN